MEQQQRLYGKHMGVWGMGLSWDCSRTGVWPCQCSPFFSHQGKEDKSLCVGLRRTQISGVPCSLGDVQVLAFS